jgi:3-deoxy-7-phosphoheptulonate synthase / chorismate mutase
MDVLGTFRNAVEEIDLEILDLLHKRGELVTSIGKTKVQEGLPINNAIREKELLTKIASINNGPYTTESLIKIYKEIYNGSRLIQGEINNTNNLLVSRTSETKNTVVKVNGEELGGGDFKFIIGPCAVEDVEQLRNVASSMASKGLKMMRGGAFKPRTSPYDFQGLGIEGLKLLNQVASEFQMTVISEVMSIDQLEIACDFLDVIQIGARNMHNFDLLKAVGKTNKPILLKRGLSATIKEFVNAAEYILSEGNPNVILCERGIRTYETATRNTLDISAVPILKSETHLPVVVDVTHSTGRKDLLIPTTRAAIAVGADGVMAEVHPNPPLALSDSKQQMNLIEFDNYMEQVSPYVNFNKYELV